MLHIKRRQFLQFAGSTLATLGLSQFNIIQKSHRYARVLAQETNRKLALLVGINNYPFGNNLAGCLTDVDLQKHLLIHRFGFNESNILTLTDNTPQKPTRQNILTAFEEHLIKQAKPGDVVVFHFSGHGSQVADPQCIYKDNQGNCINSTFIPIDNNLSFNDRENNGAVQDITGHTLFLLMSALQTEHVTVVLDSCHSGGGKRGNLTLRALRGGPQLQASPEEIQYQQQWLKRLNIRPDEYQQKLQTGVAKGVVIASAGLNEYAADAPFSGFKAGAFTYTMTQYLWQQTGSEPLESAIANIGRSTTQIASQQTPEHETQPNSNYEKQPVYFLNEQTPPAEAVVIDQQDQEVILWLGGINSESITAFDQDAILTVVDTQGKEQGWVQLLSRNGLIGRAKPIKNTQPDLLKTGTVLQERVRVIPKDITLKIGLDSSLGNDQAKTEQALRGLKQIEPLAIQQEQEIAYILGRITSENRQFQLSTGDKIPEVDSLGLFTPDLQIIPDSFGAVNEPVEAGITRLTSKFKSLLAAHLVKLIVNPGSSQLNVVASMILPDSNNDVAASIFPIRGGAGKEDDSDNSTLIIPQSSKILPVGTRLQFQVTNREEKELHVSILVIDSVGDMTVIFPNTWVTSNEATLVQAGETLRIPVRGKDQFKLTVQPPLGTVEVLVIASSTPLGESLKALQAIANRGQQKRGLPMGLTSDDVNVVMNSLLDDLNHGTRGGIAVELDDNFRGVDAKQLAAMSITFESVAAPNS